MTDAYVSELTGLAWHSAPYLVTKHRRR